MSRMIKLENFYSRVTVEPIIKALHLVYNHIRTENRIRPLALSYELCCLAQHQADNNAEFDNATITETAYRAGYEFRLLSRIMAKGFRTIETLIRTFELSNCNMMLLLGNFSDIGFGVVTTPDLLWCICLASRRDNSTHPLQMVLRSESMIANHTYEINHLKKMGRDVDSNDVKLFNAPTDNKCSIDGALTWLGHRPYPNLNEKLDKNKVSSLNEVIT